MYGSIDDKINITIEQAAGGQQQHAGEQNASGESAASEESLARAQLRKRTKIYSHCHVQSAETGDDKDARSGVDKSARRRLIAASVICLVFMIGEVVGGVLSNSLAIATDAAHLLTDFASFMISLFAIWLSSRPATRKMSFGWYRAEVIGALLSVLMIWLVTGLLIYLAIERLRTQEFEIDSFVMVITASAGLLVNIIMAIALNVDGHGHGHFHSHGGGHDHSHGGHGHNHSHDIGSHNHLDHLDDDDEDEEDHDFSDEENEHQQQEVKKQQPHVSIDCSMKTTLTSKSQQQQQQLQSSSNGSLTLEKKKSTQKPHNKNKKKKKDCKKAAKCHRAEETAGRGKSNINVRAAFIHVIGDFLQSLGVLIAALVIHFEPSYAIVDPICTFLFSFIVLVTTINIIRDAVNVLMEGIPVGINFIEVREKLQSEPYVIRVHNLRIWSLSLDKIAISTHLVIDTKQTTSAQALRRAIGLLKSSYNFFEVTIQIEEYREDMRDCERCQDDSVSIPASIGDGVGGDQRLPDGIMQNHHSSPSDAGGYQLNSSRDNILS